MALPNTAWALKLSRAFLLRPLSIQVYDPTDDSHGDDEDCRGFRGEKRIGTVTVEDGGTVVATLADWTLTELPERPVQRSIITDPNTGEQWVIDKATEHEPNAGLWDCETHLLPSEA